MQIICNNITSDLHFVLSLIYKAMKYPHKFVFHKSRSQSLLSDISHTTTLQFLPQSPIKSASQLIRLLNKASPISMTNIAKMIGLP